MKVMISQPMGGITERDILETRDRVKKELEGSGYEVVDSYLDDSEHSDESLEKRGVMNKPLYYLGSSLKIMSECDIVYFCKGWQNARGCRLEHEAAKEYNMTIVEEV